MEETLAALLGHLDRDDPGGVAGVYLYGSATGDGLRPDSDIDVLVLTRESLGTRQRAALVERLLELSGWPGHARRFPEAASRRPLDLTVVVVGGASPSVPGPRRDFQYGEWLRADLVRGHLPQPEDDPDVTVVLATALEGHRVLRGPALDEVIAEIPSGILRQAALDTIPGLLAGIEGDERNVLLTLARTLVTVDTGRIIGKDEAAAWVAPRLAGRDRALLERARSAYLGAAVDDWDSAGVRAAARRLAEMARSRRS